jgi:erythrin-vacuolar iron transport family protein
MLRMIPAFTQRRRFSDLSEQEILALAISSEEDDAQIYRTYAERLRAEYPASAAIFDGMAAEEDEHRRRLIAKHRERFGEFIPLIRREHVSGYYARRPVWLTENLGIERMREEAEAMERQAEAFYRQAAGRTSDAGTRELLGDLAAAEAGHTMKAGALEARHLDEDEKSREARAAHRQFILTWVQPGLAGLMDGSVSTLAPIFAVAFRDAGPVDDVPRGVGGFGGRGDLDGIHGGRVGRRADLGAGLARQAGDRGGSDDDGGGLGHALPYLIPHFWTATTIALIVVFVELWAIAWIQKRYMDTPFLRAAFQLGPCRANSPPRVLVPR